LLWDGLHPGGTPCPELVDLTAPADDPDRLEASAIRPRRRARFLSLGVLVAGLSAVVVMWVDLGARSRTQSAIWRPGIEHAAPPRIPLDARAPVTTSPITGRFYPSDNRCGFDTPATTSPAFRQTFPTINFGGRPFTDHVAQPGGQDRVASGAGIRAGLGRLSHFNAAFTGTFSIRGPESIPFTLVVDDAFDFGVGGGATRVRGAMSQPTAGGRTILKRLPVVGAFHQGHLQATTGVTVRFPHAGRYPYELDYAECDLGGESLQVSTGGHLLPTA
ncbi:MAG TPA: hypothetical protein VNL71_15785, partial [Chloroflexota bacterium]|nr:hypothetical protein [Chloroflexota bacterium]